MRTLTVEVMTASRANLLVSQPFDKIMPHISASLFRILSDLSKVMIEMLSILSSVDDSTDLSSS